MVCLIINIFPTKSLQDEGKRIRAVRAASDDNQQVQSKAPAIWNSKENVIKRLSNLSPDVVRNAQLNVSAPLFQALSNIGFASYMMVINSQG